MTIPRLHMAVLILLAPMLALPGVTSLHAQPVAGKNKNLKVIVNYFHGTVRCKTCNTIESYTREAVPMFFAKLLREGKLELRTADIDLEENEHFVEEFKLVSSSVVLELVNNGKRAKWKILPKVWELVHEKEKFFKYIETEIRAFVRET